jgi:hypothetical protein
MKRPDPALRKKWFFGVDTRTDWQEGSPIVHTGDLDGKPYKDKGVVKQFVPRRASARCSPTALVP